MTQRLMTLVAVILVYLVSPTHGLAQEAYMHRTAESMARSGYDYLWSVIQDEFDSIQIEDEAARFEHKELVDIIIRTGCTYNQPFKSSSFGLTALYPKLLALDPNPPLYVQYRFHSSQTSNVEDSPDKDFIGRAEALFEIAQKMEKINYPDYIVGATWMRCAEFYRDAGRADDERALYASQRGMETLIRAATLKQTPPEFQEYVAIRIARNGWQYSALTDEDQKRFCKLLLDDKDADPWIGYYATAQHNRKLAWDSRGQSWASEVSEEQWKYFRRYLMQSNRYFVKAWELRPQWPEPAVEMIGNTMGGEAYQEQPEAFWFNEAVQIRADHEKAFSRMIYALTPRWGGSMESMISFTEFVIDQSEHIPHMSYIFQECISSMANEVDGPQSVHIAQYYRPIMNTMIDEELLDPLPYKNDWQLRRLLRTIAKFNFVEGEYEHAARLLSAGGAMTNSIFKPWSEPDRFKVFSAMLATPASDPIIRGLRAMDDGDHAAAAEAFEEALIILKDPKTVLDPNLDIPYDLASELQGQIRILDY